MAPYPPTYSRSFSLVPHAQSDGGKTYQIGAKLCALSPYELGLYFRVEGMIEKLSLPSKVKGVRTDDLWQATCFELFFCFDAAEGKQTTPKAAPYWEVNIAPSSAWASYEFSGYRAGMTNCDDLRVIDVRTSSSKDKLELSARLSLGDRFAGLFARGEAGEGALARNTQIGLSAILKSMRDEKSYWAIAHPAGAPDFHHVDSYVSYMNGKQ